MSKEHVYRARLVWEGGGDTGTINYEDYGRQFRQLVAGKEDLLGSADPAFRGDASKHNPEDLFLCSIASCHMLSYLALCARAGVQVVAYTDEPIGRMALTPDGGGRFEEVTLYPVATVVDSSHAELAMKLHDRAHELCFIASSCNFPIRHEPRVEGQAKPASGGREPQGSERV